MQVGARRLVSTSKVNSVISISSRWGGRLVAASVSRTRAGTLNRSNWVDDTLTATAISPGQRRHSRQALYSTPLQIPTIKPISSATGMNSAGNTIPRSRCGQRSNASQAMMRLVFRLNSGW